MPPGFGFLHHALAGLVGQVLAVELGDGTHDAVQQHAGRRLVDVLGAADQAGTGALDGQVDLGATADAVSPVSVRLGLWEIADRSNCVVRLNHMKDACLWMRVRASDSKPLLRGTSGARWIAPESN